jgi:hypothetical protein
MAMIPPCDQRKHDRVPGDQREREREHDVVRPFWLGEGEQRSSLKRWGGGGFSAIFDKGQQNPMPGSRHLARFTRRGGNR